MIGDTSISVVECQDLINRLIDELEVYNSSTSRPGFSNFKSAFSDSDLKKIKTRGNLATARRVLASLLIDSGCTRSHIAGHLGIAPSTARSYIYSRSYKPTNKDFDVVRGLIDGNQ